LRDEAKQLRRQLKASQGLVEQLQTALRRAADTEAEKYANDVSDRTAAYFEQESNLHKIRAEKTKLQRELKQTKRKLEKIESASSGAAAQGILTDGGWDLAVERGKRLSAAEVTIIGLNSKNRALEHKLLRMTAARDAASAAERAIQAAEEEVRACIAESNEPYPFLDFETNLRSGRAVSAAEYKEARSSILNASSASAGLSKAATEEEAEALKQRVSDLTVEAESKQALVSKLQVG
jgi:hypothetical protein